MIRTRNIILIFSVFLFTKLVFATESDEQKSEIKDMSRINKIEDEYRKYLLTIKDNIAEEIIDFRQKIDKLNQIGNEDLKNLSLAAREYVNHEKDFKKKLPLDKFVHNNKITYSKNMDKELSKIDSRIVEENFRTYAANVPEKVINEVRKWKEGVKSLNYKKIKTYTQLSQDAQAYLHQFQIYHNKI